jgi:hypothetical protein
MTKCPGLVQGKSLDAHDFARRFTINSASSSTPSPPNMWSRHYVGCGHGDARRDNEHGLMPDAPPACADCTRRMRPSGFYTDRRGGYFTLSGIMA